MEKPEYGKLFETPLEEIREDIFFRADNFQREKWYEDLRMYLTIGVCQPDKESISDLQKALKILGYSTRTAERDGKPYLVPQREQQKQPPARKQRDRER